jgi:protein TonB
MELKKSNKANLERMRGLFFQVGLILALGLVLTAFKWGKYSKTFDFTDDPGYPLDLMDEPVTIQPTQPIKHAPPPVQPEILLLTTFDDPTFDPLDFTEPDVDLIIPTFGVDFGNNIPPETTEIYEEFTVDIQAEFMGGGTEKFQKWVMEHIKYPQVAIDNGIDGKVFIKFVIDRTGNLTGIKIVRGVDESLDEESVRVLNLSPQWKPAIKNSKPVAVQYQMPLNYRLQ